MEFTVNTDRKIISFKGRIKINDLIDELADLGIDFQEYFIEGEPYTFTPITFPEIKPIQPFQPLTPYPWDNQFPWITQPTTPIFQPCTVCYVNG